MEWGWIRMGKRHNKMKWDNRGEHFYVVVDCSFKDDAIKIEEIIFQTQPIALYYRCWNKGEAFEQEQIFLGIQHNKHYQFQPNNRSDFLLENQTNHSYFNFKINPSLSPSIKHIHNLNHNLNPNLNVYFTCRILSTR